MQDDLKNIIASAACEDSAERVGRAGELQNADISAHDIQSESGEKNDREKNFDPKAPYLIIENKRLNRVWNYCDHGIKRLWQAATDPMHILQDADVSDSIVGKAAALLMVFGGVKSVRAGVLSEGGKQVFETFDIPYKFGRLAPFIVNRKGDGLCPMEQAVAECTPSLAVVAVERKLKELGLI